ncbi:hypothetical protein POTOM_044240 [Populus tomentosa]|uniref:Uncharacterized protein n=1 Tax=Populus tomentosa TaxID=118781 RepID=A0A8X7YJ39_POPTO|nr:hypothetical protein POTOM_044240 [Populus tomentosa]
MSVITVYSVITECRLLRDACYSWLMTSGVLNCPLLLIQVSRLKCGGFLFALRLNHTMSDGQGLVQFMAAVAEMARGANAPSVPPVWERHVLHSVGLETCRT